MTERYEGFGQSIRRVMEQKEHNPGIIGVVADIIRVEKDYEIAIETALGGSIQNIVTDNEQTAKAMICPSEKEPLWTCHVPSVDEYFRKGSQSGTEYSAGAGCGRFWILAGSCGGEI